MNSVSSQAKQRKALWKYVFSFTFLILILYVTLRAILKDTSIAEIRASLQAANLTWVAAGFGLMLVYQLIWAEIIRSLLYHLNGGYAPFRVAVNTAFAGYYFNNITPSSSGGQPMQMLYLHRCGIDLAGASIIFFVNTIFNNIVMILYATVLLIVQYDFISQNLYAMRYALIVGYVFNGFLLVLNLFLLFFPKQLRAISYQILAWITRGRLKPKANKFKRNLDKFLGSYSAGAFSLLKVPRLLLKLLLLHAIQFAVYNLIPFMAGMALGASPSIFLPSFALQSVLTLAVSGFPTPGAVGITEGGFVAMFSGLFPPGQVESAMILTRLINFYVFLILAAIITIIAFATAKKDKLRSL
ncbi:MAG: lysylphosphatidylglycerol synthase transmembrane domain-containing protein [Eubacteriales bacterium]|nr:lysylphosphatidylglycerol synthase transmembrane domain-containing protein [Eubacteriales bacterium]